MVEGDERGGRIEEVAHRRGSCCCYCSLQIVDEGARRRRSGGGMGYEDTEEKGLARGRPALEHE